VTLVDGAADRIGHETGKQEPNRGCAVKGRAWTSRGRFSWLRRSWENCSTSLTISARTSGMAATAFSSACSLSTIAIGVPPSAHRRFSSPRRRSRERRPLLSLNVGCCGAAGTRVVEVTPSARSLPAATCASAVPVSANISAT
jgi:hypothetical protein